MVEENYGLVLCCVCGGAYCRNDYPYIPREKVCIRIAVGMNTKPRDNNFTPEVYYFLPVSFSCWQVDRQKTPTLLSLVSIRPLFCSMVCRCLQYNPPPTY